MLYDIIRIGVIKVSKPALSSAKDHPGNLFIEEIGSAVKNARRGKGVSQMELARRVGTSQAHISRLERGGLNPTVELLYRIATEMEMKVTISFE